MICKNCIFSKESRIPEFLICNLLSMEGLRLVQPRETCEHCTLEEDKPNE